MLKRTHLGRGDRLLQETSCALEAGCRQETSCAPWQHQLHHLESVEEVLAEEPPVVDRISEIELVDEKMTNDRLGAVYVYPVEVYVHVPEDHAIWLSDLVSQFQHEIRAEMATLWRQADPAVLQDPRMKVMTDRIETLLRTRFEGEAKPELSRIVKVVIVSGTGFRIRS